MNRNKYTYSEELQSISVSHYIFQNTPIGKGSYSTVYKGYDTLNDTVVAVKKMHKETVHKKGLISRIYKEVELLKALSACENIIKIYDVVENDQFVYLMLEYCNGGDLESILSKRVLIAKESSYLIKQILNGVKYMYSNNVLHRDMKPSNILIHYAYNNTENEDSMPNISNAIIKITDFNFGKFFDNHTDMTATICGSPLYMAPEIIKYSPKHNSDIWSLGLIFYYMLYSYHPFQHCNSIHELDEEFEDLIKRRKKLSFERISLGGEIPIEYINLLQSMLDPISVCRCTWDELLSFGTNTKPLQCYSSFMNVTIDEKILNREETSVRRSEPVITKMIPNNLSNREKTMYITGVSMGVIERSMHTASPIPSPSSLKSAFTYMSKSVGSVITKTINYISSMSKSSESLQEVTPDGFVLFEDEKN